ncbi:hypothetical protein UFOVP679_55 [uncultured Caudovirales phage]|uniref:Tail tubular protein A n=1 Tax=uncultured Caudovirales phage TaxID=2100421 RepID=A0A6J5NJK7_9CAUD|nr:hypothetical protein UFOVP679_55 [uncultured Caudovirales phage]
MIENYGTLKAAVARRAVRTDLTDDIPDFIRSAHDKIVGEVSLAVDLTLTTGTTALPTDFRQVNSLWLVNRPWIQVCEASPEQMSTATGTGRPYIFRISGSDLIVYPVPEPAYPAKLLYQISRDFFATDVASNAILTRYPSVYLYGAVAELGRQTADDDLITRFQPMFFAEIVRINQIETGDAMRGPLQITSSAP